MRYSVCMAERDEGRDQPGGAVKERVKPKTKEPTLYSVVLLNDDYTPMQFVVEVLEAIFQKSPAEAYRIMMQVHMGGPRRRRRLPVGSGGNESRLVARRSARGRASAAGDDRKRIKGPAKAGHDVHVFTRS